VASLRDELTFAMLRPRLALAVILTAVVVTGLAAQSKPIEFIPTKFYNTFSGAHPPALHIKPGDRIATKTIDSGGTDWNGNHAADGGNPETGPFYVDGVEPGDMLVVNILKLETNRTTANSSSLLAPYTVDPQTLLARKLQGQRANWIIDKAKSVARLEATDEISPALELPLRPMLGCLAVAPARGEAIATSTPGPFGGNMDYAGLNAGVKVMFAVNVPGALLFLGDAHARQGEGEVVGTGLETSMDVEFSVEVVKKKTFTWPRLENNDYIMVLGSARPLLEALQHATSGLQGWLMTDYGYSERSAASLMGQAMEYEVSNVVDPNFTVVAKMKKSLLIKK
jgi:amidase